MHRYRVTVSIGIPDRAFELESDPIEQIADAAEEITANVVMAIRTFAVDNPLYADVEEFESALEEVSEDDEG